tara:strand:- start:66973 stop:67200 length:228 start_codon:yes stop_codon:yes gene_type:complete
MCGTVEVSTGVGKTFIALHALHSMNPNEDLHLYLAETTEREKDLLKSISLFDKIFKVDTMKSYNIKFYCYQSAYR